MKTIGRYVTLTKEELDKKLKGAKDTGKKDGEKLSKVRIENLEKGLERKDKEHVKAVDDFTDKLDALKTASARKEQEYEENMKEMSTKISVLEEERDDTREVLQTKIKNADKEAVLTALKDTLDEKEARLKTREAKLGTEEDKRYKEGYADGVADGVRKISEITKDDRKQAMQIAMVAAASHSKPEVIKEALNVPQLPAGDEDKKGK